MSGIHQECGVQVAPSNRIPTVHLLNGPYVSIGGERLEVPEGSKRLLAFMALQKGRLERRYVAGALWPLGDDIRAAGNLRSALWRLRGAGVDVVDADKWSIGLAGHVAVDIDATSDWARRILTDAPLYHDFFDFGEKVRALDLLPGCYDDWAITEREMMRQKILHALEKMSQMLTAQKRFSQAVEAAMVAVGCEPLRESAQRVLISAHLAEGNLVEARRVFCKYAALLRRELGVDPSVDLQSLVHLSRRADQHRPHVDHLRVGAAGLIPAAAPVL